MRFLFLILLGLSTVIPAKACSCFGPQSFCGVLDPPFAQPEWWIPDAVVLGVKLTSVAHGMDIVVLNSFAGQLHPGDTIRVWGDNGILCRMYTDAWEVGDTLVWGIHHTDLAGGALEQPEDYRISVCGVYWLEVTNGEVTGPITTEGANEAVPLAEFELLVHGCLTTAVPELQDRDPMIIRQGAEGTSIVLSDPDRVQLTISDAAGRTCIARDWDGTPLGLNALPVGMYTVMVENGMTRWTKKVVVR